MKALVLIGSRADRNGSEEVFITLNQSGHKAALIPFHSMGEGTAVMRDQEVYSAANIAAKLEPDVVIASGDRIEMLKMVVYFAELGLPIAHIAGGDVTEGSADNRYRDAITALASVHFATNERAYRRLVERLPNLWPVSNIYLTGSPAIDRIRHTRINPDKSDVLSQFCMKGDRPVALVCVHPNTDGGNAFADYNTVVRAVHQSGLQCIFLGANADSGGEAINDMLADLCANHTEPMFSFHHTVSPEMYYSLMTHCDVMIGNSSAMLYESPSFGLPCVLVGDRQHGRLIPGNVIITTRGPDAIAMSIKIALDGGRIKCENPYGDGHSAPRIVKALEERWSV